MIQVSRILTRSSSTSKSHVFKLASTDFETHNCPKPSTSIAISKEQGLDLYKTMVTIRRIETASDQVSIRITESMES